MNEQHRAKLIEEVASWVTAHEDYPAAVAPFGRLRMIVDRLNNALITDRNNKDRAMALIRDLVAACERKGMKFLSEQKREILPSP